MQVADILAGIAALIGVGLGAYAMINPKWASNVVRLVPAPGKVEGKSEFRATYGGLFFGGHAAVLGLMLTSQPGYEVGGLVLGYCWLGSAFGRMVSMWADKAVTGLNIFNLVFEAVLAVMLAAPFLKAYSGG